MHNKLTSVISVSETKVAWAWNHRWVRTCTLPCARGTDYWFEFWHHKEGCLADETLLGGPVLLHKVGLSGCSGQQAARARAVNVGFKVLIFKFRSGSERDFLVVVTK